MPRHHEPAAWLGIMTDTALTGPWSLFVDSHYNTRAFVVIRGGLTLRSRLGPSLTGGYAHLWTDPGNGTFSRDEYRPWAQAFLPFSFADDWTMSQRLRTELRIQEQTSGGTVSDGFWVTPRFRSQTAASYFLPIPGRVRYFVQTAVELFANAGPNAGPNFLDQTRWSLLFGYHIDSTTIRIGYMDRFVPSRQGTSPLHEHDVLFWVNFKRTSGSQYRADVPEGGNP